MRPARLRGVGIGRDSVAKQVSGRAFRFAPGSHPPGVEGLVELFLLGKAPAVRPASTAPTVKDMRIIEFSPSVSAE